MSYVTRIGGIVFVAAAMPAFAFAGSDDDQPTRPAVTRPNEHDEARIEKSIPVERGAVRPSVERPAPMVRPERGERPGGHDRASVQTNSVVPHPRSGAHERAPMITGSEIKVAPIAPTTMPTRRRCGLPTSRR